MSSTVNVQNLLTNVFRPVFTYDTASNVYQTKLELTNIDSVSANTLIAYAAKIGDTLGNVYVGIGAGNQHSLYLTSSNVSNTFIGTSAGGATSNIQNGVFIGANAGYNSPAASNSISIGANTHNGGNSNIYIGCGAGIATGSNNIFLGAGINSTTIPAISSVSNTLLIGSGSNTSIVGDLVGNRIGINLQSLPATLTPLSLDVNGYARVGTDSKGGLGINMEPGYHSLQVNGSMQVSDGYGVLTFDNDGNGNSVTSISNTGPYSSSNATLQVTGGYFSSNGITSGSTYNIPLKKGMFMISAISNSTAQGYLGISYDTSHQTLVSSNSGALITSNAGSLVIAANTKWVVTYFPSP